MTDDCPAMGRSEDDATTYTREQVARSGLGSAALAQLGREALGRLVGLSLALSARYDGATPADEPDEHIVVLQAHLGNALAATLGPAAMLRFHAAVSDRLIVDAADGLADEIAQHLGGDR